MVSSRSFRTSVLKERRATTWSILFSKYPPNSGFCFTCSVLFYTSVEFYDFLLSCSYKNWYFSFRWLKFQFHLQLFPWLASTFLLPMKKAILAMHSWMFYLLCRYWHRYPRLFWTKSLNTCKTGRKTQVLCNSSSQQSSWNCFTEHSQSALLHGQTRVSAQRPCMALNNHPSETVTHMDPRLLDSSACRATVEVQLALHRHSSPVKCS